MVGVLKRAANYIMGYYDDDSDEDDYMEYEDEGGSDSPVLNETFKKSQGNQNPYNNRNTNNVINFRAQGSYTGSVVITKPESLEDAQQIVDYLKERRTVFLNLEDIDHALARRIVDFLSGSVYSLEADFQKASQFGFIIAPSNVEVQPLKNEFRSSRGFFPFANGNYR